MEAALGLAALPAAPADPEPPAPPPPARPPRRTHPRRPPPEQESLPLAPPTGSETGVPPAGGVVSLPVKPEGLVERLNRLRADLAAGQEDLTRTRAEVDRLLRRAESLKEEWEPQLLSLLQASEEILARPLEQIHAAARELVTAQDQGATAIERLIRDASEEAARRAAATEEVLSTAERRLAALGARTDEATRKWDQWAREMAARAEKATRALTWRGRLRQMVPHLAAACLCGVTIVLMMTWTRPAWTLTAEQREALRVGQGVTELYLNSSPEQQALMRRTNRWREPFSAEPRAEAPRATR